MYLYIDETKKMSSNEACFGGIITPHRPAYLEKIYREFLQNYNIKEKGGEVKSWDKSIQRGMSQLIEFIEKHNIQVFGVYISNYKDSPESYIKILSHIAHHLPLQGYEVIADRVILGIKPRKIQQYILNTTGKHLHINFLNSKSSAGLKFADLICGLCRKKYIFKETIHNFDNISFDLGYFLL